MKNKFIFGLMGVFLLALVLTPMAIVRAERDNEHDDEDKVKTTLSTEVQAQVKDIDSQIKNLQDQLEALKKKRNELIGQNKPQNNGQICKELRSQLRQGMQGDEVKALQEALAEDPDVFPIGLVTGFFGPATKQAVIKFQNKHGLNGVGEVGPQTRAMLMVKLKTRCGNINLPPIGIPYPTTSPGTTTPPNMFKVEMCQNPGTSSQTLIEVPISDVFAKIKAGFKIGKCPVIATSTPPVTDTTAPLISNLTAENVATTSAKIKWSTNEPATTKVWFGTTSPVTTASSMVENTSLVTSHEIWLNTLIASTTYYFKVESKDAANNNIASSQMSFTTTH